MSLKKMDPAIKLKWIEALESDEFTHGQGCLKNQEVRWDAETGERTIEASHCCLGVLQEIAIKEGVISRIVMDKSLKRSKGSYLSREVAKWAGIARHDPNNVQGHQVKLADINDHWENHDYSKQIAYIKENM